MQKQVSLLIFISWYLVKSKTNILSGAAIRIYGSAEPEEMFTASQHC